MLSSNPNSSNLTLKHEPDLKLEPEPESESKSKSKSGHKSNHSKSTMLSSNPNSSNLTLKHEPETQHEPFDKFYEDWLIVQERDLRELMTMARTFSESTQFCAESTLCLQELVDRVMSHHEEFYQTRFESIKKNVLVVLNPDWLSKLEEAFLWIGGWRPTTALHLLYSKAGLQFDARLNEVLKGVDTEDLGILSSSQLVRVDELQRQTIKEERKLTEILASHQETMADPSMVELSENYTVLMRQTESGTRIGEGTESNSMKERVCTALAPKEHGLEEILVKADDLRLRTLKQVVDILSPIQAVHFLIADAQLHLRVHEWGKQKDKHTKDMQEAQHKAQV